MPARGGPLTGIRVIDFTQYVNGPVSTGQMADQGADVLKIEEAVGEGNRHTNAPGNYNSGFEPPNRGKRSMTLDLKHPGARAVMERLCRWADVLAENFRPGVMDKLGFGYDTVRGWNPRIIYASNSGFGARGEWAERPAYDGMAQAMSGVMVANGGGPSHIPREIPWVFSDTVGANNFYGAILAALIARGRTGEGQHVVTSQTGAAICFQNLSIAGSLNLRSGKQPDDGKTTWQESIWQQKHKAADGRWLVVSFLQRRQFERFCRVAIKRPDLLRESVVTKWPAVKPEEQDWIRAEVAAEIAKRPLNHWVDAVVAANVPCAPVATYADLGDARGTVGRQARENGYVVLARHRDYGPLQVAGYPTEFRGTPLAPLAELASVHAPHIGEHSTEALRDVGYSDAEAVELVRTGVVPPARGAYAEAASRAARVAGAERIAKARAKL